MSRRNLTKEEILQEQKQVEAAKKNPERFGVLYDKYYRDIFLFVIKRCGEEELAGDLVSQVFLKAMLNLKKYKFKGVPFSAWLYRIASNEVNQYFRKTKNDRTVSLEKDGIERLMEQADESGGGLRDDYQQVLVETLSEMKEEEVQIIELRFFEKLPFSEVGFILGITENNAKVRVYRILERLKKKLLQKAGSIYE